MHNRPRYVHKSASSAKFAALQITGAGLLVALWLSGYGQMLLVGDRFHAVPVLAAITLAGLVMAWRGKWDTVFWIADLLPTCALVGTVAGFILTSSMGDWSSATGKTAIAQHILYALVSNLTGIVGYVWLTVTQKVCET